MKTDEDLRFAVVGVGQIAESVHLPVLSTLPGVTICGVVDPRPERRELARARWTGIRTFASIDELTDVDVPHALLVCTPPDQHVDPALRAFELGAHLYLEKPIAARSEDARIIVEASKGSARVSMLGFNYRYHPGVNEVARRLAAGEIGARVAIRTFFSVPAAGPDDWRRVRARGGGALLDLGAHHFDLLRFITGADAIDVSASISSRQSEDDMALVSVRLSDGSCAQSLFALGAAESDRVEVFGEDGSLALDRLRGEVELHPAKFEYGRATVLRELSRDAMRATRRILRRPGERSYRLALSAFLRATRGEDVDPLPTLEDGLRALEWIEAAMESSATRSTVALSPASDPGISHVRS